MHVVRNAVSHQGVLSESLERIFPGEYIVLNGRWGTAASPVSGSPLEFDAWLPNLALVFEFQDAHHYGTTWYYQNSTLSATSKDHTKKLAIHGRQEHLVEIPVWWDASLSSLISSICFARPDLQSALSPTTPLSFPIVLNPPFEFFPSGNIPEIGEPMLASFANPNVPVDTSDWWMGEKYDGVRCIWNPVQQALYARRGREVLLPDSFHLSCTLSKIFMDCELWSGRGSYALVSDLLHDKLVDSNWAMSRLIVFDNPDPLENNLPFEDRYSSLLTNYVCSSSPLVVAPRMLATKCFPVDSMVHEIISNGGEGIILRKPFSIYEHGRSNSLLKRKHQSDTEALVVGIDDQSCLLKLSNNSKISVPLADFPLKIGDLVTIAFDYDPHHFGSGNPTIVRIRNDVLWKDVVNNGQHFQISSRRNVNDKSQPKKPHQISPWATITHRRAYFDELAAGFQFDPLLCDNWYWIDATTVSKLKIHPVLQYYDGDYINALMHLYPNIGLSKERFQAVSDWRSASRQRLESAHHSELDPFMTERWQALNDSKNLPMFEFYKSTLLDFLEQKKQPFMQASESTHRQFFDQFARKHYFDALQPQNWYRVPRNTILAATGANSILARYGGSHIDALLHVYPSIGLAESKFVQRRKPKI